MADVPTYGGRKQTLRPIMTAKMDSRATPDAFGAGVGRALQNLAGGVQQAANAFASVQEFEDKAIVDDRVNQYSDYARDRTYNPETGYVMTEGENAVNGRAGFEDDLEAKREEIGKGLSPRQQRLYNDATEARRRQALDTSIRHAAAQRKQWFDDASTARLETLANDALAMSGEPEKLAITLKAAENEIAERAATHGWSAEQTQAAQTEFRSGVHKNIVLKQAVADPLGAKAWMDANRDSMTEAHQIELDKALDGPVLHAQAQQEAERILRGEIGADNEGAARPPRASASPDLSQRTLSGYARLQSPNGADVENLTDDTKAAFGKLQETLGRELPIKSGYRSPERNRRARGAKRSRHMHGDAIDVDVRGMTKAERLAFIEAAFDAGFTGIGVGPNSIHIDRGKPRAWGYITPAGGGPVPAYAAGLINERLAALRAGGGGEQAQQVEVSTEVQAAKSFHGWTVAGGGKGYTDFVSPDGTVQRRKGTRAWRNNNPGNIEYGNFARAHGAIGTDGRFAVFPSYEAGRKAKASLLFETSRYKNRTIAGAIARYAPQFENDTAAYASTVANAIGVPTSTRLSELTAEQRSAMLDAMEKVEGFKPGGQTNRGTIPGYVGPQYIANQVAHIEDPRLRAETAAALTRMQAAQDATDRRTERQNKLAAEKWIIQNPGADPTQLPLEIQMQLGTDGMNTLWSYNDHIKQSGAVETDEVLFADLQRLQAEDPYAFAEDIDLFDYIDRLSTTDRRALQQLQANAIKDRREGREEALTQAKSVSTAMSIASDRLEAAGIRKTGKQATEESRIRESRFQSALIDRMREFQEQEKRVPNDYEVSGMVDQLLLPIIIKEPGLLWGTNSEKGFAFEAPFRADNAQVEIDIPYENIPVDVRLAIREELAKELGRDPTEDEIKADYVEFVLTGE